MTHSSAGGGGGGGALQLQAGGRAVIDGVVEVTGGRGGDNLDTLIPGSQSTLDRFAAPGGGGAGGALLLQAPEIQIAGEPGRIDVTGGPGGTQNSPLYSVGGQGAPGLVRLDSLALLAANLEAPKIEPFDPAEPLSPEILSVGLFPVKTEGPSALSGAQSCWLRPPVGALEWTFLPDDLGDPASPVLGWDVQIVLNAPGLPALSYRDPNGAFGGPGAPLSIEQLVGSDLLGPNPAPLAIRFQGVRTAGKIPDLCDVDLDPAAGQVVPESLTGWVRHPAELSTFWDPLGPAIAAERRPDRIRFAVVFDNRTALFPGGVLGITDLFIWAQPE